MNYFLFIFYTTITVVCSLECGISSTHNQELRRATNICMNDKKFSQEESKENSYEVESSEHSDETRNASFTSQDSSNEDDKNISQLTTTGEISSDCVIHCVLSHFDMIDESDYPDRNKITQGLLGNADGRELKDFLRDSADECYQILEQGVLPQRIEHIQQDAGAELLRDVWERTYLCLNDGGGFGERLYLDVIFDIYFY